MNFLEGGTDPLDLENIRRTLIRLEDTIIFCLIERAQFAYNPRMYTQEGFADVLHKDGFKGSWLDWLLKETETSHAKIRRFDSPDEHPFTPLSELPKPILPPLNYPTLLVPNDINVNPSIKSFYIEKVVPVITKTVTEQLGKANDDGNYGSAGTRDLELLQAVSRRIHCGMFVSESKFLACPSDFIPHILANPPNREALEALITKPAVEAALLVRLEKKARWYGMEIGPSGDFVEGTNKKVEADVVVGLYRDFVIPLTRDVEVDYLVMRLDGMSKEEIDELMKK
ncbi:chorismate mutase [Pseudohyphozyma bogoriensis]|nr:chorismate mutase [Pseudohyphozyma bogoriensis]